MKYWITYHPKPQPSPITMPVCLSRGGWTSKATSPPTEAEARLLEEAFTAAPPRPVPGKGYPYFHVLIDRFEWEFGSLAEIDVVVRTLSTRNLPNVRSLNWWVNRLPSGMTGWTKRQRIIRALRQARLAFQKEVGAS